MSATPSDRRGADVETRVITEVDLDRDGKQYGTLRLPYSRNTSAWGAVQVPIIVIKRGDGPTVLMTAGAHGDEYEGPVTLAKLARALEPSQIRGRVILLPSMNVPALAACQRLCPIDGRDLNRSYPGDAHGSFTGMLAHYIAHVLVPRADLVVDFHSGGYSLEFLPCVVAHHLDHATMRQRTMDAMHAFGAPLGLVLVELDAGSTLDTFVERQGTLFLSTELRGGARISPDAARVAERGAWNLLHHAGVIAADHPRLPRDPSDETRLVETPDLGCYVVAPEDGVYEPFLELGAEVEAGQEIGQLHFLAHPQREPVVLRAGRAGLLFAKRYPGKTEGGDTVAVIARDLASA